MGLFLLLHFKFKNNSLILSSPVNSDIYMMVCILFSLCSKCCTKEWCKSFKNSWLEDLSGTQLMNLMFSMYNTKVSICVDLLACSIATYELVVSVLWRHPKHVPNRTTQQGRCYLFFNLKLLHINTGQPLPIKIVVFLHTFQEHLREKKE